MWVWLDGRLLPAAEACLPLDDRGLLLGEGLFETLLARRGRVIEAAAHLARLAKSARSLGLPLPWAADQLEEAMGQLLAAHREQSSAGEATALRLTLTGGSGPRGLLPPEPPRPRLFITARPHAPPQPEQPATLVLAPHRLAAGSPLRGHKSLSAWEMVLAARYAHEHGADSALLLNDRGELVEGAAANLFLVDAEGRLLTPPLTAGALPGITRARILQLAAALGMATEVEASLSLESLDRAQACFLSSSLLGIRRVASIRDAQAGAELWRAPSDEAGGRAHDVVRRLRLALAEAWER